MGRKRKAGSESAGYHSDLSIPGFTPKTPTVAPSPSEAARGPAGDYAGAGREYEAAVEALPAAAQAVTEAATQKAAAEEHAARVAKRAETRQKRLVSKYVTHAYSRSLEKKGVPATDIGARIEENKQQLDRDRETLLSHPTVQDANASGKVVGPKGLRRVNRDVSRLKSQVIEGDTKKVGDPLGSIVGTVKGAYEGMARDQPGAGVARDAVKAEAQNLGEAVKESVEDTVSGRDFLKPAPSAKQLQAASLIPAFGATSKAGKAAETVGPELLSKVLGAAEKVRAIPGAAKRAPEAVRAIPGAAKAGVKEAPSALKAAAKSAPGAAGRRAAKGTAGAYHSVGGLAVLGTAQRGGLNIPGGALLEGQAKALEHDPGKVFSSTANLAPGLLTGAFQLPVAAGASAVTGSTKPLEGAVNEQVDFFKHFAETYGGSDVKAIEKATLEEGLLPEVLAGPFAAKALERGTRGLRGKARETVEGRRALATDAEGTVLTHEHGGAVKRGRQRVPEPSKVTRLGEHNVHRREEAFHASTTNDTIQLEHARRREGIDKHARKAAGKKTVVREGLGPKGKDTLHQRPPDYIPFLNRAGIDLHNPDAALREIQHYAEKFKGLDHPSKYGVNPEALTARDAVKFFTDHPEALKDKHLASALDEFRSMQNGEKGLRSLNTSDRNRYLAHAVMHDIPDAKDRVPIGAREHTDATTREGAWEDLGKRTKQVKDLRKEGRKKYDQAQEASPERAVKLRSEAKATYEKARAIDKGRRELHDALKNFTRPGAKANPNAKRMAYDEALEKEMVDEARASLKDKGLHPEPAYMPDTDAINRATPDETASGGPKPLPGGAKINEGYNWRHGLTRQGYEHMMNEGILRQVARNHQFENARRFRADRGIQFEGEFQHTGKGWAKAFDHGVMNRRDVALVPTQVVNRLEKATQGGDPTEYEAALAEMQAARKVDPKDAQSGTIYEAYPKAAYDEWVAQAQKTNIPSALRKANRFTSMNMLSTPAFVGAQVVAETAQAIAEVNPARMMQGLHAYNKLTPEQKLRISGASGETAKAIFSPEDLQTTLGSYDEKPFVDALGFFRRNVFGRSAKSFATLHAAGELDRLKGSYIRRGTLTGQIMRDLNGTWAKGRKLLKLQTAIQKQIGHLKPHEQLAWIAEHPKVLDRYQKDLHDAMGGWGNLTKTGKVPESVRAATLIFYPYLRMSIQWPLKYAARHPIKATALAYLAAENNFALKEALEGDPSFLNYAQIPVYGVGEDGKPTTINLSRIAPGGNALVTAVQGSGSLLGALQPVLAAGIEGATGQGPLGAVEGGVLEHLKAAGAGILGLSPYVRAADTLKGQKDSGQSEYGVLGKRANIALNPLAALSSKLKGSKGEQLTRSLAFPFLPQNIDHQRDYAKLGRILTKLGDTGSSAQAKQQATKGTASEQRAVRAKVEAMQAENAKAEKQLEAMYAKYGLSKVAARSLDVYKYTHPYPEEEKKGPYEGSGYEGSGYEGSGYGGEGAKEKPVPVPQMSDGVGLKLPGLGGVVGDIASPLASLIGGAKASAAELPKGKGLSLDTVISSSSAPKKSPSVLTTANALVKQGIGDDKALAAAKTLSPTQRKQLLASAPTITRGVKGNSARQTRANAALGNQLSGFGIDAQKAAAIARASKKYGVPAPLLAAIGKVESSNGTSTLPGVHSGQNSAGAGGPFQIGNGTGAAGDWWHENMPASANIYDYADAAEGAAKYLKKAGVTADPSTWNAGALAYNHAQWYADEVVGYAKQAQSKLWKAAGGQASGSVPKKVMTRYQAAITAASQLNGLNNKGQLPYVWGGGHVAGKVAPGAGLDCSGAVSYVLQQMGVKLPGGVVSGNMGGYLKPGPGAVTVFYNPEHTFMKIGDKYFGTSHANPGGGAGFIPTSYEKGEAESGAYNVGHVAGLGKNVAVALGVGTAGTGSTTSAFPGMSVTTTSSGTTATIQPGKATTKKEAGFSDKPIKLTGSQRLKLVNEITSGNLEGLGIPGFTPKVGPSAADLAAIGAAIDTERRKLLRTA